MSNLLPHIPIQARGIDLALSLAETDIQDWGTVLKLLEKLPLTYNTVLISEVVKIYVLVP
jgi:hypothetical protein